MPQGPLAGLRVIDLTDDGGRFATKLLAELGASVARIGRGSAGPPMASAPGGLLDWWYDAGKERLDVDLGSPGGADAYRSLARAADLIVETEAPGRLASLRLDHADLVETNPRLVQVSLTPFGRTGPRAAWQSTDLVTAALGGWLSVCGVPDEPVVPWGRQALVFGGFHAAICGLAGVRAARASGRGQHVDLSLHEVATTSCEHLFFQHWFDDVLPYPKVPGRQGSLHWSGAYEVVPAGSGSVMVTLTPAFPAIFDWLLEAGFPEAADLVALSLEDLVARIPEIMEIVKRFARTGDAAELWIEAQKRRLAWAEVQPVAKVAANPQHAHRGFLRPVEGAPDVRVPGPLARFLATPAPAPRPPATVPTAVDDVLTSWGRGSVAPDAPGVPAAAGVSGGKPLDGVRVLDLTHVLAGPHATRILGDLGADVVKLQTAERATSVNDPAHPYFYVWNRSKRAIALDMKDDRAVDVARRLVEASDVLIENFSAHVLDRWGLSYEQVRAWNPRVVYVSMSGCGHEGPWSELLTYAPTIHALSGITYLSNPEGRSDVGPGFSVNDHAAGLSAAVSVLAALEARERTGEGQHVDIAQMETGAYLIGPALLDLVANSREAHPAGNVDPFGCLVPNECYRTIDGAFLAVSCRDDDDWARLVQVTGIDAAAELATLEGRRSRTDEVDRLLATWAAAVTASAAQDLLQTAGVPAGVVQDTSDLMADPQHVARQLWRRRDHAVFGERPYDRFPAIWSGTDLEPYLPPPAYVGEHSFDVYAEVAGMDAAEVAEGMGDGLFS